jgi:hypothetical protein
MVKNRSLELDGPEPGAYLIPSLACARHVAARRAVRRQPGHLSMPYSRHVVITKAYLTMKGQVSRGHFVSAAGSKTRTYSNGK